MLWKILFLAVVAYVWVMVLSTHLNRPWEKVAREIQAAGVRR